jgi:hypothetical protein
LKVLIGEEPRGESPQAANGASQTAAAGAARPGPVPADVPSYPTGTAAAHFNCGHDPEMIMDQKTAFVAYNEMQ